MSKKSANKLPNNTNDVRDRQEELISSANAALREKVDWVIGWYKQDSRQGLLSRWTLGQQILDILEDKTKGAKTYGASAFSTVAAFSGEAESSLRICAEFARKYTSEKQVVELSEMTMADGVTPLSFSHIRHIITLESAEQRQKAINEALLNCWTSDQLGKYVQLMKGGNQSNNASGRPLARPKDLAGVIGQQIQFADDFEKRNLKVWRDPETSVTGRLEKLTPEQYTDQLAEQLGILAHRMRQLSDEAAQRAEEAEQQYEAVRAAIDNRIGKGVLLASQIGSSRDTSDSEEERTPSRRKLVNA